MNSGMMLLITFLVSEVHTDHGAGCSIGLPCATLAYEHFMPDFYLHPGSCAYGPEISAHTGC